MQCYGTHMHPAPDETSVRNRNGARHLSSSSFQAMTVNFSENLQCSPFLALQDAQEVVGVSQSVNERYQLDL